MTKELAKKEELLTPDTITKDDVRKLFCPNATDKEITMFIQIAKLNQLNPLKREIYLVKYKEGTPASILTGYEVYLKRAERSGKYLGFKVWVEGENENMKACIEVRRKDWEEPLYHEVDYSEYVQMKWDTVAKKSIPNKFWKEKPKTMLKKVVISQGLRFAFPDELAGMPYVREEINPEEVAEANSTPKLEIKPPEALPEAISAPVTKTEKAHNNTEQPELSDLPAEADTTSSKPLQQRFKDAYAILGKEQYFLILGKYGVRSTSEIKKEEEAHKVIQALENAVDLQEFADEDSI